MTRWTVTFEGLPERLSDVRRFTVKALGDARGVDDVVLVVSELAANAIRHSASGAPDGSFTLNLAAFSDHWHIRVDDQGSSKTPRVLPADEQQDDEAGRGLPLVVAVARAWGVLGDTVGRTVWADIPFPETDRAPEIPEGDVVGVRGEPDLSVVV
jgi:hypothetical protein